MVQSFSGCVTLTQPYSSCSSASFSGLAENLHIALCSADKPCSPVYDLSRERMQILILGYTLQQQQINKQPTRSYIRYYFS